MHSSKPWSGKVALDYARHRRILNLKKNYARLNQWPEWFTVDENTLYSVQNADTGKREILLGSDLKSGYPVAVVRGETRRLAIGRVQ